jgi:hypothetical protein
MIAGRLIVILVALWVAVTILVGVLHAVRWLIWVALVVTVLVLLLSAHQKGRSGGRLP